jgi:hypothetical protein
MCKENNSLQDGDNSKFTVAKTSEIYKGKFAIWLWNYVL